MCGVTLFSLHGLLTPQPLVPPELTPQTHSVMDAVQDGRPVMEAMQANKWAVLVCVVRGLAIPWNYSKQLRSQCEFCFVF